MLDEFDDLFTIDELCEILMIGRNTVYQILNTGKVAVFRIRRRWEIPKKSIQALLDQISAAQ